MGSLNAIRGAVLAGKCDQYELFPALGIRKLFGAGQHELITNGAGSVAILGPPSALDVIRYAVLLAPPPNSLIEAARASAKYNFDGHERTEIVLHLPAPTALAVSGRHHDHSGLVSFFSNVQ